MKWARAWKRIMAVMVCLCLGFSLIGCSAREKPLIIAASSQSYEQVLAWMVAELAQKQGIDVKVVSVDGGIQNLQPALAGGSVDIAVEFAQSAWSYVLKEDGAYKPGDLATLQKAYEQMSLIWCPVSMVVDHFTLAVRQSTAEEYQLETISDLKDAASQMVLGADSAWFSTEDGFPWISNQYGLTFKNTLILPEDSLYGALTREKVDIIPVHSLDGNTYHSYVVQLEDDQGSYSSSTAGIVVQSKVWEQYPQLSQIMDELFYNIQTNDILFLSSEVVKENLTAQEAAVFGLEKKGLLEEKAA